jgi:hypothetical protein
VRGTVDADVGGGAVEVVVIGGRVVVVGATVVAMVVGAGRMVVDALVRVDASPQPPMTTTNIENTSVAGRRDRISSVA